MENEDKEIRKLFERSLPELTSDREFIKRIERSIAAVDLALINQKDLKTINRKRAFIAGISGFMSGVILTLLYPFIIDLLESIFITFMLPSSFMSLISTTGCCAIITAGSLGGAIGVYIFLNKLPSNKSDIRFFKG